MVFAGAVKAASPSSYVDANDPPTLLLHGEADAVVPVAQSRDMEARMKALADEANRKAAEMEKADAERQRVRPSRSK